VLLAIAAVFIFSSGAREFLSTFANPTRMRQAFFGDPAENITPMWQAFLKNVLLFCLAEPLVLLLALPVALIRNSRSPIMAGPRLLATIYVDAARGLPLILVVFAVFFGFPILGIPVLSTMTAFQYGLLCLVFSYTAYVSEVYRAGVMSIPHTQLLAGRAIGLTELQVTRFVTVPQALRFALAPLINDFVSLEKDTAIVGTGAGMIEAFKAASIDQSIWFNDTSYTVAGLLFLAVCVPLTRYADRLIRKDQQRRLAGQPPRRRRVAVPATAGSEHS